MARANKIEVKSNIPIVGTLQYCDLVTGQYGPQVRLKGDFTSGAQTAPTVYLPVDCLNQLIALNGVETEGEVSDKGVSHRVLQRGPYSILRTEEGTRKHTTITLDGARPATGAPSARTA